MPQLVKVRVIKEKVVFPKTLPGEKKNNKEKRIVKKRKIKRIAHKKKEKIVDLRKVKKLAEIPPSSYHSNKKVAKKNKPKKVVPVFGLSPLSVKGNGGKEGFRVGNTLMIKPGKKIVPPDKVKPYNGPPLTPIALVDRLPRFKKRVVPKYPEKLREMGIEGVVVLDVVISKEGKVVSAKVVKGEYPEFVTAAIKAIKASTFTPAMMHGKPVAVKIRIPVRFRLVE